MNAPPPAMPDPMKLSRMIRLLNDYVAEGLLQKPERPFKTMTEGELDDLIDVARVRREERENPEPAEANEPEEEPEEAPAVAPRPGPQMPEPAQAEEPQPEGTNVSEEGQLTEQEFYEKFPKGTHVEYAGDEYVVTAQGTPGAEGVPHLECMAIYPENTTLEKGEFEEGSFQVHENPTKIPQKTEYPPQVFLYAYEDDDENVKAEVHLNHQALQAIHSDIDGDAIMEAISDPGTAQVLDGSGRTLTFASIG